MNDIIFKNDKIYITNVQNFDITQTLDCGQAFRWNELQNGAWGGIAYGKYIELAYENENIVISNTSDNNFNTCVLHGPQQL